MTPRTAAAIPIARPQLGEEEKQQVLRVLDSGTLVAGPRVAEFEAVFAAYLGVPHAVSTSSGSTALHVALLALGIGLGDRVVTTPFTFGAPSHAIIHVGAEPVFVDVDPATANLDPGAVEDALRRGGVRAIMAVHLYGLPASMPELRELADRYGTLLIEDCAQAHGASIDGRKVGTFGDAAIFSFYPTKNMTTGEGGMITTNDDEIARRARIIRNHGQEVRYRHDLFGLNWRMQDLNAAIGLAQLEQLEGWTRARIANAERLSSLIRGFETPRVREGDRHVFHQYTIRVPRDRDRLQQRLQEAGIGTAIHYPVPIHQQPIIRELGLGEGAFPVAEAAAAQVLSLPVHPGLEPEDVEYIAATLNRLRG
ncbi:MAG: DegT/DnrJ/EryC1/StrS family aminotransferase [Dehalococcoidia bacterium]|nr:DegT/DnrJ/EryC1/StrS family aminotransferase [Dehalococcoidia bacterium]